MPRTALSEKLRALRTSRWPGRRVLQSRVAEALGVAAPSISAYETGKVPPADRLDAYAIFFASPRWLDAEAPPRVSVDFLDPDEYGTYQALSTDLRAAAAAAHSADTAADAQDFWTFPADQAIRVFCGRLGDEDAGEYGDPTNPNYMRLRNAADTDSLLELWGHLRSRSPLNNIRFRLGDDFSGDDLNAHIVILGNIAQEQGAGALIPAGLLPIRQTHVADLQGEVFEIDGADGPEQFRPTVNGGRLIQDVGMLARVPSPHHTERTLTVCSGVFTRGVYGAVRATTAEPTASANLAHLRKTLPDVESFALLIRVPVTGHAVATPDLQDDRNVLHVTPGTS